MEKGNTESFCQWFSRDRMGSYVSWADQCGVSASCLYAMNLQLSESLYVSLQTLEILLRNRVHEVLAAEHGEFWFERHEGVLCITRQHDQIRAAANDLQRQGRIVSSGGVISHLTLSFWTMMFNKEHETLWQRTLHRIASDSGLRGLRRKQFSTPLVRIRHLRNRIAHHEPILHWPLVEHHADIMQLMEWLAPLAARWCSQQDRFPETLTRCGQHLPGRNGN